MVVIAGTGFGAQVQVPGFRVLPEADVAAICSARPERARAAVEQLRLPAAYTDSCRGRLRISRGRSSQRSGPAG